MLAALVFVLALSAASAKPSRPSWNLTVYSRVTSTNVRAVSAKDSSFVYEGTVDLTWRDDSLCNGPFSPEFLDPAQIKGTPFRSGDTYVAGDDVYSALAWPYLTAGPSIAASLSPLLSATTNSASFNIDGGTPSWIPDAYNKSACYVTGTLSISATFLAVQQLQDFPFDTQKISFSIIMKPFPVTDMTFDIVPSSNLKLALPPDGFAVVASSATVGTKTTASGEDFSRIIVSYTIKRDPTFYVQRFVLPLCLVHIMLISSMVLGTGTTSRHGVPLAAFGSTVSFLFVYAQTVPSLPYQTRLDKFFTLCFLNSFVVMMTGMCAFARWDRFAKARAEMTKRGGGFCGSCWSRAAMAPVVAASAAPAPAAEHADKPKPSSFFAIVAELAPDANYDMAEISVLTLVFAIVTACILVGPST